MVKGDYQLIRRCVDERHQTVEVEDALRKSLDGSRFFCARITAADGTELSAEVYEPEVEKARGAVIFVHGFGGNKGENGLFHSLAARCVREGFAAVLYDWRGIAQSAGDFPTSTLADHEADFELVAGWVKDRVAPSQTALHAVGFSLGAAVIGLAVRNRHSSFTSVVYLSPASRPRRSMWPRYEELWGEAKAHGVIEKPGGDVLLGPRILESLRETDLGPEAFQLEMPLLVCHGTADSRVDYTHTEELVARMDRERNFRHVRFEGASHSFRPAADSGENHWVKLGDELVTWFGGAQRPSHRNHW
ncbi:MAG: alpha/beta fold hydrolase [Actinobacteria bacterium]|nr:alpha/beta fold hydrolase [Actinomycetota bacterium]